MRQSFIISLFIQHPTLMYVQSWLIALDMLFISQEFSKSTKPPERSNPLRNTLCVPETWTNSVLVTTSTFSRCKSVLKILLAHTFICVCSQYIIYWILKLKSVHLYVKIFSLITVLIQQNLHHSFGHSQSSTNAQTCVFVWCFSLCLQLSKCLLLFPLNTLYHI